MPHKCNFFSYLWAILTPTHKNRPSSKSKKGGVAITFAQDLLQCVVIIMMEEEGDSRANPICLSDNSPILIEQSPVKLLTKKKQSKCKYKKLAVAILVGSTFVF